MLILNFDKKLFLELIHKVYDLWFKGISEFNHPIA